ncbi:MAG: leucine-rich repeat protein [Bacilli bacterium]|nr:leucine-rich repeat protein [Bacilli bacterium]
MFKDKLKQLREKENLSQQELADIIFVSRSAIAKWENGNGLPSNVNIKAICDHFNVNEEWLIERKELKENIEKSYDKEKNIKIIFFASTAFMLLFCLLIGGRYWLHRIAIILTAIYLIFKLLLSNNKANKIICICAAIFSLIISIINWLITAIPEPSNLFRIFSLFSNNDKISINNLNMTLSQLSSILNILMLTSVNILFFIIYKDKKRNNMSMPVLILMSIIIMTGVFASIVLKENNYYELIILSEISIIEEEQYSYRTDIKSIVLNDNITTIKDNAFYECTGLESITIPSNVKSIGNYAFYNCSSLKSIVIPKSVTKIGFNAFAGCDNLTSVVIENGNEVYDSRDNCNGIIKTSNNCLIMGFSSTVIPDTVTSIESFAFFNCRSLKSIIIPDSVTLIHDYAFAGCSGLESVILPNKITTLPGYMFRDCTSLKSITMPNNIMVIGNGAFTNCSSLVDVKMPNDIISILSSTFYGCESLENINIPNSVTTIYEYAFGKCSSLKNLYISAYVNSIDPSAFDGCIGLESIIVDENNKVFDSRNNCNAIIHTSSNALYVGCSSTIIPDSITQIRYAAFMGRSNLTTIILPESIKAIGNCAFSDCTLLETIIYNGTQDQWNKIRLDELWIQGVEELLIICTDANISINENGQING